MPTAQKAIAIGLFVLVIGLAFPTFITAANDTSTSTVELSEGGSQEVTEGLRATADSVNASGANITMTDLETYQEQSEAITTGDRVSYSLQGESFNVTVNSTDTSPTLNTTVLSIDHDPTYGWNSGAKTITDNIGLVLAILTLIIGAGAIVAVT